MGVGDPIFQRGDPSPIGIIRSIIPDSLTMARTRSSEPIRLLLGQPIPDTENLVCHGAVLVRTQENRHRIVGRRSGRVLDEELYLVKVRGTRTTIQMDVELPFTMAQPTTAPQSPSDGIDRAASLGHQGG